MAAASRSSNRMALISVQVQRLLPEVFRAVGTALAPGFDSGDDKTSLSLVDITRVCLGPAPAVAVGMAKLRLVAHSGVKKALIKKQIDSEHRDELALSFGFLERSGENYVRGIFGMIPLVFDALESKDNLFDRQRAIRGLLLLSLLARNGDAVVAVVSSLMRNEGTKQSTAAIRMLENGIPRRYSALKASQLPAGIARLEVERHLHDLVLRWQPKQRRSPEDSNPAEDPPPSRQLLKEPTRPLSDSARNGYYSRTVTYLEDLGLCQRQPEEAILTASGLRLAKALALCGYVNLDSDKVALPPSYEAVHDAFSVSWGAYTTLGEPPNTRGMLENIVQSTVLNSSAPVPWRTRQSELKDFFHTIVTASAEINSRTARIDTIRCAMFLYCLGRGEAVMLDEDNWGRDRDLNANAPVEFALRDPGRYSVGRGAAGRRFWSITLQR